LVTGHTGFKGSWLALWLCELGARVTGYALAPETSSALFEAARVEELLVRHIVGDIRDRSAVFAAVPEAQPEIVLHLAARTVPRGVCPARRTLFRQRRRHDGCPGRRRRS
jgi:CDP-glucose 4,6-dehydratase